MVTMRWEGAGLRGFTMKLERFADNVRDAKPAFEAMADHVAETNQAQFNSQGAHSGQPWAPLSPKYEAWKAKNFPGRPIMVRSGDLKDSLTQRPFGVDEVTDHGFTVGTAVPYAQYHQHGTAYMPQRKLIGDPSRADTRIFAKILQSWIVERSVKGF